MQIEGNVMRRLLSVVVVASLIVVLWIRFTPSPLKAPTQTNMPSVRVWTKDDSLAYARDKLEVFAYKQYSCLVQLWNHESHWNPHAYNKVKSMGLNAGGIPQVLGMSTSTPPASQIDRGLIYIYQRYGIPCAAWKHWQRKGWY